jgi:hypothetical protein
MSISKQLMAKPTILTDAEQKTVSEHIYNLAKASQINGTDLENMKMNWNYYNDIFDEQKFKYLTKIGNYDLPAKLRHIPMQRHYIDLLVSQQSHRPFAFSIHSIDEESVKGRYYRVIDGIMNVIKKNIKIRVSELLMQKQQIEMKLQQLQQLLNKEPETQDEAMQLESIRQQMPMIQSQYQMIIEELEDGANISQDELNDVERKMTYDEKDMKEELAQKILLKLRKNLNIEKKSIANLRNQCVTGRQYYYVDYISGHKYPIFEIVDPQKVVFPKIDSIDWVQEGPWCGIMDRISYEQFEIMYSEDFKKRHGIEKYDSLMKANGYEYGQNATFASTPGYGAVLVGSGDYNYDSNSNNTLERTRIWFKVNQRIRIKKSVNPYLQGKYFRHFIDAEKYLIDKDDYTYSNGFYFSKSNSTEKYPGKKTDTYSSSKGDDIIVRNVGQVYQAVMIGGEYLVDIKRCEFVYRNQNDYTITELPIIGPTYSGNQKPYSLIRSTMDLQNLYNIVHYHQELMLALSGAKGNVIDRSQKPGSMTDEEWEYQSKLGRLYIQTMGEDGRTIRNSSFNQWPSFDNTLSPAIQYLENFKASIKETMGEIIGISRARQGQTVASDQVGTFNQSINQSALITEILFNDHDEVERRALNHLVNIAARYCFNAETILEVPIDSLGIQAVKIPPKLFTDSFFDIVIANNTREEQNMRDLKQLALQQNAKNLMPFYQVLDIYNTETLKDLEKKVAYFTKKSEELAAKQNSSNIEQGKQAQLEIEQFKKEYDMAAAKMTAQVKEMELNFKKAEMEMKQQQFDQTMQFKNYELAAKLETQNREIDSERSIEAAYLESQDKHQTVDEQIRAMELQLNMITNQLADLRQKEKNQIDYKKVSTGPASNPQPKEKISDR